MARKASLPDRVYYLREVLCLLATIPMYRYILVHAADGARSSPPPVREQKRAIW